MYVLVYFGVLHDDESVQLAYSNRIFPLPDVRWQSHAHANSDANSDTNANANTYSDANSDTDTNTNTNADTDTNSDTNAGASCESNESQLKLHVQCGRYGKVSGQRIRYKWRSHAG